MNQKKSKAIRRLVYGDGSKRNEGRYTRNEKGVIRAVGKRQTYIKAKKEANKRK